MLSRQCYAVRACRAVGYWTALIPIMNSLVVPAKSRQQCKQQRQHPDGQQRQHKPPMQPELSTLKRTHDAPITLVVHQHQVKEKGQEQKVRKDVHQQAGREAERAVQAHPGDEGKRHAGAQVGHQQAQEEVVL